MDSLNVDPDEVRGAGRVVEQAPTTAASGSGPAVTPPAADATSVQFASQLRALIDELHGQTTTTHARSQAAAQRLNSSAAQYENQETASSAALGGTGDGGRVADLPSAAAPTAANIAPIPASSGVIPTTGHEIATLMHGGPGPTALDETAAALDSKASELDGSAAAIRAGRSRTRDAWQSEAADNADHHLTGLERSYSDQAQQARTLATHARSHADNFRQARAQIPKPEVFSDLERRLQAANRANAQPGSMGRFSGTIADLQGKLAAANQQAVQGFGQYTAAAGAHEMTAAAPHLTDPQQPAGPAPGRKPVSGKDAGSELDGTDTDTAAPGDELAGDPADPALMGGPADNASQMLQTVLPAVLGGVSGVAGGVLGAVSGAGQKLQELGSQAAGGAAQGANSALTSAMSAAPPGGGNGSGSGGAPEMGDLGGGVGDGGLPGDTEPASSPSGPLSPPSTTAGATGAPAAAAPATASTPSTPSTPSTGGAPMAGGMVPPMMGAPMGGRGAGGGSEDDRRLYPERRLHIEAPPNTEPVKGRREARKAKEAGESK